MKIPYYLIFRFITNRIKLFNMDESHGIKHSLDVLNYASGIVENESILNPNFHADKKVIYTSALLHDMCDKKYMDEKKGLKDIENFLVQDLKYEKSKTNLITNIIDTMSYSKIKKNGFPNMGKYQTEYNVVREADLLAAYDVDRSIIYNMTLNNYDFESSILNTNALYEKRMGKHLDDNLFTFDYTKKKAKQLNNDAQERLYYINKLLE